MNSVATMNAVLIPPQASSHTICTAFAKAGRLVRSHPQEAMRFARCPTKAYLNSVVATLNAVIYRIPSCLGCLDKCLADRDLP